MPMISVNLHGALREFGPSHKLDAASPHEAIRGLCMMMPQLANVVVDGRYEVLISESPAGLDELTMRVNQPCRVDVIPAVDGAASGAGKIVIGAALITASVLSGGMAAGAAGLLATAAHAGMAIGVSMALQGASSLLTHAPNTQYENKSSTTKTNTYFDGPLNTSGQGLPVPIVYGKVDAGSVVASASVEVEQL